MGGQNQKLVNAKTGQPFAFELMLLSGSNFQYVLPFRHNLQRLGIDMAIRGSTPRNIRAACANATSI